MNRRRPSIAARAALTWLEVVVLLAVVSALVVLLLPVSKMTCINTRSDKAATIVKNIVNAAKAYHNEYDRFPNLPAAQNGSPGNSYLSFGDTSEGRCKLDNSHLFNVLRALPIGSNLHDTLNPRKTRYFEEGKATDKKKPREGFTDGPDFPESLRGRLFDLWGREYCIVLDADGDDAINLGTFYSDLASPEKTVRTSAGAFSLGKDGQRGSKNHPGLFRKPDSDDAPDDIASWQ